MLASEAFDLSARLTGWALTLQAFEFLAIARRSDFFKVWSPLHLEAEFSEAFPQPLSWIRGFLSRKFFVCSAGLQLVMAIGALVAPHPFWFVILFFTHLSFSVRFRGTFNGGSDMMMQVLLTGLLVGYFHLHWGLLYITVHLVFSYFKAGFVKLRRREWLAGQALSAFLRQGPRRLGQALGSRLMQHSGWSRMLSWAALAFELGVITIFIWPCTGIVYLVAAVIFHFFIYAAFGLNRFFWVWLAAWPPLLHLSG